MRAPAKFFASQQFIVPFEIIERVVELIISGEIVGYRYDEMNEELKTIDLKFQI